jgi:hypothetical protein
MENKTPYNYNEEALKQIESSCMTAVIIVAFIIIIIFSFFLFIK